jgi:hypothetical protein
MKDAVDLKVVKLRLGKVAHACNPTYLGGKDQEDCNSEPAHLNQ